MFFFSLLPAYLVVAIILFKLYKNNNNIEIIKLKYASFKWGQDSSVDIVYRSGFFFSFVFKPIMFSFVSFYIHF